MNNLYQLDEFHKKSYFQRLLKKEPKENALIEVNNLLASKELNEIKHEDIESISLKYKVDLYKSFSVELKEFYQRYQRSCIKCKRS